MAIYESSRRRAVVELPLHKAEWPLQEMINAGQM